MKRKKTEILMECVRVSDVEKKKKNDYVDSADTFEEHTNEELSGEKKSEASEDVTEVKKKTKKEKSVHVDTTESSDLENEELNGKKEKAHKNKQPVIPEKDDINEEEDVEDADEDEDEEELSPEETRVLERKLKKILKKEEKKKQKEKEKSEKEESKSCIAQTQALEYLMCWSEKRDEWKFQKTRQVWLLQQMYDSEKVSDSHFSILLSYLEGLRGMARDLTVQKAETLVRFGAGPGGEEEGGATEAQKKTQRAREVIQILS